MNSHIVVTVLDLEPPFVDQELHEISRKYIPGKDVGRHLESTNKDLVIDLWKTPSLKTQRSILFMCMVQMRLDYLSTHHALSLVPFPVNYIAFFECLLLDICLKPD